MADKTVMDMFADMAKQINLPKMDYEPFLDIHRKNIEAMQKSGAVLSEGGRAVLAKQQEILAQVGREARQMIADFKPGGSPQEVVAKQAELAKRVFEATVKNTRDVAELVQKSSSEAPRSFLIGCAKALPKHVRQSRPKRLDTRRGPCMGSARIGSAAAREIL